MVGVDQLKKSLGALKRQQVSYPKFKTNIQFKVRRSRPENAANVRKAAFGRIASVARQISDELDFLDFVKGKLRNMPTIDFEAFYDGYSRISKCRKIHAAPSDHSSRAKSLGLSVYNSWNSNRAL